MFGPGQRYNSVGEHEDFEYDFHSGGEDAKDDAGLLSEPPEVVSGLIAEPEPRGNAGDAGAKDVERGEKTLELDWRISSPEKHQVGYDWDVDDDEEKPPDEVVASPLYLRVGGQFFYQDQGGDDPNESDD